MKITQKAALGGLLALIVVTGFGLYLTSGGPNAIERLSKQSLNQEKPAINQQYLNTVIELAQATETPEEQAAARKALDDADHELDLEYAYALQLAAIEPIPKTPEIHGIKERIEKIRAAIDTREAEIAQLQAAIPNLRGERRDVLKEQLDVGQAELNLFREALSDARDDLTQAGGNPKAVLATLKAEHVAASNAADRFKFPALSGAERRGSLLSKWSEWRTIHSRWTQINSARRQVIAYSADLGRLDKALDARISDEQAKRKALKTKELTPQQIEALEKKAAQSRGRRPRPAPPKPAAPSPATGSAAGPAAAAAAAAAPISPDIALIQHLSADQILERLIDRRVETVADLVAAYRIWSGVVESEAHVALHRVLAGVLAILLVMLVAFFVNRIIERVFVQLQLERKQRTTIEAMLRISVRLVAALAILMMIFGKPNQLSTVLGLAGAGLAVALQDFILSFLGWFVLMGANGIRVGDSVEIMQTSPGVRGEVIEINLLRTVLHETGNWNESGHLTGRRVAFMNMYAVTGYFFNFSTAGQWLWDEIQVAIPENQNPYPLIERIRNVVVSETQADAKLAEEEWQRVSARYGTQTPSAEPSVNVKPADHGVVAIVRYVAKADDRAATRYRLNLAIVNLFQQGSELGSGPEIVPDPSAAS